MLHEVVDRNSVGGRCWDLAISYGGARELCDANCVILLNLAGSVTPISYERGVAGSEPFELDARLLGNDGTYRWFLIRYNPLVEKERARRW